MTVISDTQIVPRPSASTPALRAADRGVADALESVLADNTRRVYGAQWRLFNDWCDSVVLRSMPAEPLTVARYLAVRAGSGASIATLRLATSAIAKAHEWAGHESPGKHRGVRAALKGWGTPAGQAPAAGRRPHRRRVVRCRVEAFRGFISHLRRCAALGRRPRPRHRVVRSKTDVEAQGAVVAITFDACGPWTPSSRRVLTLSRKYSGCRSRGSPGGSRRSPKSPAWPTLSIRRMLSLLMTKRGYGLANRSQRESTSDLSELLAPLLCVGHDPVDQFPIVIRVVTHG